MIIFFNDLLMIIYFIAALLLLVYGANCYVMIGLFRKKSQSAGLSALKVDEKYKDLENWDWPKVTTQIPVYNEYNVALRAIDAACRMDYPKGLHDVQILDDSNDETRQLIIDHVKKLKGEGFAVEVVHRATRIGFKAGALDEGLKLSQAEFVAVFDADFVPTADFLYKTVPHFLEDKKVGLVQARWGHLNRTSSLLTRAQSLGIDGHFMVEQSARSWNGLFMNFNGTAGIWRRESIDASGGWEWDTLTEDMDLSYRMQLEGWTTAYLPHVVVPAELPEDVRAFKNQQFRWAKGSIQTAKKIMPRVWKADVSFFKKLQAFFHMTHYVVHPLMIVVAVLSLPILLNLQMSLSPILFFTFAGILAFSMMAPNALYIVSQRAAHKDWKKRILILPALVMVGVGVAVSNTRAVLEALAGKESDFIRTPKKGDQPGKEYGIKLPKLIFIELGLGVYCSIAFYYYILHSKFLVSPFLAMYALGFLFIGTLSLIHSLQSSRKVSVL